MNICQKKKFQTKKLEGPSDSPWYPENIFRKWKLGHRYGIYEKADKISKKCSKQFSKNQQKKNNSPKNKKKNWPKKKSKSKKMSKNRNEHGFFGKIH